MIKILTTILLLNLYTPFETYFHTTEKSGKAVETAKCNPSKTYYTGPKGGCYYINKNGNKTYVAPGCCGIPTPAIDDLSGTQKLTAPSVSNCSYNGKQLHVGPKGGCFYITSGGHKKYVYRWRCNNCLN